MRLIQVKNLNSEQNVKSRIRSVVWDFLNTNKWKDPDDFSLELSDRLYETILQSNLSSESLLRILGRIRTAFFMANGISKKRFADTLLLDIGKQVISIVSRGRAIIPLTASETPMKAKILFLAANPKNTVRLRLDEEIREVERRILLVQKKDQLILVNKGAVRVGDLQFHLNQERPTIVHFSGHGTGEGRIILEDDLGNAKTVPPKALARVFKVLKDNIRCVVLNACFSSVQAHAISQHIDCVVGMSSSISDKAAIAFSTAFYLAIASEKSVKNAFDQGVNELMLLGIPEEHNPRLLSRENTDPSKIFLLASTSSETKDRIQEKARDLSKKRNKERIDYIEDIQAYIFFPLGTPRENQTLDYHAKHFRTRLIANLKVRPPKIFYCGVETYGWKLINKYPELWIAESDPAPHDGGFTKTWAEQNGFRLIPKNAEKKDLLESSLNPTELLDQKLDASLKILQRQHDDRLLSEIIEQTSNKEMRKKEN